MTNLIEFHRKFGVAVAPSPAVPDDATSTLRAKLIDEEYAELMDAIGRDDLLFSVRRLRSRTEFTLPLVTVAAGLVGYGVFGFLAARRAALNPH